MIMTKIRKRHNGNGSKAKIPRALRTQAVRRYLKPNFSSDAVAEQWDPTRSARQNLNAMGLAHNPNMAVTVGNPSMGNEFEDPRLAGPKRDPCELFVSPESGGSDELMPARVTRLDVNEQRRAKGQTEDDQKYAVRLLQRHGENYEVGSWRGCCSQVARGSA
jgi:hypothetical protein